MARPVVGNPFENQIPTVSPTASPVETYVRPAVKKSPFEALANTLSNLERKAVPALQAEEKRRAEREFAEGQELYNKTRKAIGEAVKDGIIAEGESPYLRKGYRIANLNVLSARYANELNNALTARKLYTNGNPAAIEEFTEKFYKDFQEKHQFNSFGATEVAEYFSSSAAKANEAFRSSWKSKHIEYQRQQQYIAFQNEVSTYAEALFLDTDTPEAREVKIANLGNWATSKAREAGLDGMNMAKVNQTITDSIIMSAYEMQDSSILDVLDNVQTGTGTLGGTLATRKAVFDAKGNIAQMIAQQDKAAAAALEAQQQQAIDAAMSSGLVSAFEARSGDPDSLATFERSIIELKRVGTAEAIAKAQSLTNFYDAQTKAGRDERNVDDVLYGEVMVLMHGAETFEEAMDIVTDALNDDSISASQSNTLLNQWDRVNGRNSPDRIDFLDTTTGVPQVIKSFLPTLSKTPMDALTGADALMVQRAEIQFQNEYLVELEKARKTNPDLTNVDKRNIALQVMESLRRVYVNPEAEQGVQDNLQLIQIDRDAADLAAEIEAQTISTGDGTVPDFN
ncbi:hypothetical protein CRP125_gp37 [Roseobacter phage CRP-125]|uniref:Uncharacterized protein n=1 Tax=Roseobacter phage CRP-125 TaxID=3072844 RepID=A0AAX3ZY87_9CAUD|nr:hypothetical protein CRP125_gp37 [Roseobacter phage CRP-125]